MKRLFIALASATAIALGLGGAAQADTPPSFGEDLSSDENQPLTSTPNADQARDNFFSQLSGVKTEDFEGLSPGATEPITLKFGSTTGILIGGGMINNLPTGTDGGLYPISGNQYWSFKDSTTDIINDSFSIIFSEPQVALGFYATDIGDTQGGSQFNLAFDLLNGGTMMLPLDYTSAIPGGSVFYFGLIDVENPFTSVTFTSDSPSGIDDLAIDDLSVVSLNPVETKVPEPSSILGILALAAFGVGSRLLRKHKSASSVTSDV